MPLELQSRYTRVNVSIEAACMSCRADRNQRHLSCSTPQASHNPPGFHLPSAVWTQRCLLLAPLHTTDMWNTHMLRAQAKHEITAPTEYITALLLARVHRLSQHNDAIRGGISAFHYHMLIWHVVSLEKKGANVSNWETCYESIRQVIGGLHRPPGCEGEIKWNGKIIAVWIEPVNLSGFSPLEFVATEHRQKEKKTSKA